MSRSSSEDKISNSKACLRRVSSDLGARPELIPLENRKVIIGRALDANHILASDMISRYHAILSENEQGQWSVLDNKSLNGIFVNGERVRPMEQISLKEGDNIQLGVTLPSTHTAAGTSYIYKFSNGTRMKHGSSSGGERRAKRMRVDKADTVDGPSTSHEPVKEEENSRSQSPLLAEHSYSISGNENHVEGMEAKAGSSSQLMNIQEQKALQKRLQDLEKLVAVQNAELKKVNQEKLDTSIEVIDEVSAEEVVETSTSQGKESPPVKSESSSKSPEPEVVPIQALTDIVESELTCSICSELFIQTVTLNCSHSFCQLCILQWRSRAQAAKTCECPICRAVITSEVRSVVLDSLISRMVDQLGKEARDQREELVKERREKEQTVAQLAADKRPPRVVIIDDPILISEDEEDSHDFPFDSDDDISDSDDSSVGQYVNYRPGRCRSCGDRGHWADECPY